MFNDRQGGWMGGAGMMRPHAMQTGGYDSSGINPGGQHVPQAPQGLSQFFQLGQMRPYGQSQGGYDSSGINPGGMYSGQMPQTPHYGQGLQRFGQSSYQPMGGLAGMFRGYYGQQ